MVVLDAEFRALSNGITFRWGHQAKSGGLTPITHFRDQFSTYTWDRFAFETVLCLRLVVLDAEFQALSNGITSGRGHRAKIGGSTPITHF